MRTIFFILLVSIVFQPEIKRQPVIYNGGGTSIMVFVTKDTVWFIADSKRSTTNMEDGTTTYSTICKINKYNNIYYAFAGSMVTMELMGGFKIYDADVLMRNQIEKYKNIDSAFYYFDKSIKTKLKISCTANNGADSINFKKQILNHELLQVTAITFVNKKLTPKIRTYAAYGKSIRDLQIITDMDMEKTELPFLNTMGYNDHILKKMSDHNFAPNIHDIKKWGTDLIKLEINAHPNYVGFPVDIIAIGNDNNYRWISKNQPCDF